jgi:dolichyl-phosphate-mannose--protein O-mannosyl transferase
MNPKTVVIWLLALITFLSGAIAQYFYQRHAQPPTTVASVVLCALLTFLWYRMDTDQRPYRRTYLLNVGIVGFALIAFPYYFFRSRGIKGGFVASLLFVLSILGSILISMAGRYLVFFATQT